MKHGSTLFLKAVLVIMAVSALGIDIFWLIPLTNHVAAVDPQLAPLQYPFLGYVFLYSIPFFIGLNQAFKLLCFIDENKAFSQKFVTALRNIAFCAVSIISMMVIGEVYVTLYLKGDKAHLVAMGLYISFASSVIATFAAILQKLIQNAIDIKSENDLTV